MNFFSHFLFITAVVSVYSNRERVLMCMYLCHRLGTKLHRLHYWHQCKTKCYWTKLIKWILLFKWWLVTERVAITTPNRSLLMNKWAKFTGMTLDSRRAILSNCILCAVPKLSILRIHTSYNHFWQNLLFAAIMARNRQTVWPNIGVDLGFSCV